MTKLSLLPDNPEENVGRFPSWLHRSLPKGGQIFKTNTILEKYQLNTVCEEAKCPNRFECYTKKTATFLALGKECTRNCGFCDIDFSKTPKAPSEDEPERIALSVKELGLKHAVVTMVARDDLEDCGASHIAAIIRAIRHTNPGVTIEVLTSDFAKENEESSNVKRQYSTPKNEAFSGDPEAYVKRLYTVLNERPEIFNHNIETVRALSPRVRHKATYDRTLTLLQAAKSSRLPTFVKSGIMLGLGETPEQVKETITDLAKAGCDIITMGQYLQASNKKLRVKAFITPEQFKEYEDFGHSLGVPHMYCGPFVRSSYNANLFAPILST